MKKTGMTEKQLRNQLSTRIDNRCLKALDEKASCSEQMRQQLFMLISDHDTRVASNALWIWSHAANREYEWLRPRLGLLSQTAIGNSHESVRRLALSCILTVGMRCGRECLEEECGTELLDFCLEHITMKGELPGTKSLCLKIAHAISRPYPELMREFNLTIELLKEQPMTPAIRSAIKNIGKY